MISLHSTKISGALEGSKAIASFPEQCEKVIKEDGYLQD